MQIVSAAPYLTRTERKMLHEKSNFRATVALLKHWLLIAATFVLVYWYPNPVVILMALFILGGQQLACAILMHDAGHAAVFKNRKINDFVGQWFGAYPIFQDAHKYSDYHYRHHVSNGTIEDPDLGLTRGYPASRKSMFRKIFRDLSGQTGVRSFTGIIMMHLGYMVYNLGGTVERVSQKNRSWPSFFKTFIRQLHGPILANLFLFILLYWLANPWLYLLWIAAYFTTFQFSLRIRSIAEHSVLSDPADPYKNTRSTKANFLERLLFAPYFVNYHCEHHLLMAVPSYNLPKMHALLKERGFYEKGVLASGYWEVLQLVVKKDLDQETKQAS